MYITALYYIQILRKPKARMIEKNIMNELPTVSVIIPTFNRKEILVREIESVVASSYPPDKLEIIVIDDSCSDGTYEYVSKKFPIVKIIRNPHEKGLAGSRNVGISASHGDFIFVLDDDNILDKSTIRELVDVMIKDDKIGIAGPGMYYYKSPKRIWCMGIRRNYMTSITKFLYRDKEISYDLDDLIDSEDFPNAFMIRRDLIDRIGFFDEKTFLIHYDEADFGRRAKNAGYKIVCIPRAKIWHDISLPEEVRDKARLFHCQNEFRAFYCGRNRVVFHRKYSSRLHFFLFISIFNWIIALYYGKIILTGSDKPLKERFKIAKAYVKGVLAGLVAS